MEEEFSEELKVVLKKMCEIVCAKYEDIDFKEHNWYYKHEWTEEGEQVFRDWLEEHLKDNKVRKALMRFSSLGRRKKYREQFVREFVMNYGWKTKRACSTINKGDIDAV